MHAGRLAPWSHHRGKIRDKQLFPALEATPDLTRGEQRLAAEVALCVLRCEDVPSFAHQRAFDVLRVMACG